MAPTASVTMADVAARAGVSTATVSRALRGAPGVSAQTRLRIQGLAQTLSYVISPEASHLAGGATGRVAVLVHDLGSWYSCALLGGIYRTMAGADLDLLLYNVDTAAERQSFFERLPARRKVDALVVVSLPLTDQERSRLDLLGVPVVVTGTSDECYPSICVDDVVAAQQAVKHLVSLGHRRIALLNTVSIDGTPWASHSDRRRGYLQALAEADLPVDPELMVSISMGQAGGARGMDRLLSARQLPTAVFAFSDEVAIGALRSLRRAQLKVPEQMSVIGLDDHPMAELTDLTTVHQDVAELGRLCGGVVIALLEGAQPTPEVVQPRTHLVVRGTTAPPGS